MRNLILALLVVGLSTQVLCTPKGKRPPVETIEETEEDSADGSDGGSNESSLELVKGKGSSSNKVVAEKEEAKVKLVKEIQYDLMEVLTENEVGALIQHIARVLAQIMQNQTAHNQITRFVAVIKDYLNSPNAPEQISHWAKVVFDFLTNDTVNDPQAENAAKFMHTKVRQIMNLVHDDKLHKLIKAVQELFVGSSNLQFAGVMGSMSALLHLEFEKLALGGVGATIGFSA